MATQYFTQKNLEIELKTYNMEAKMTQLEIAALAYEMVYYSTQFN